MIASHTRESMWHVLWLRPRREGQSWRSSREMAWLVDVWSNADKDYQRAGDERRVGDDGLRNMYRGE